MKEEIWKWEWKEQNSNWSGKSKRQKIEACVNNVVVEMGRPCRFCEKWQMAKHSMELELKAISWRCCRCGFEADTVVKLQNPEHRRFYVAAAMTVKITVVLDATSCSMVEVHLCFIVAYCLQLQGRRETRVTIQTSSYRKERCYFLSASLVVRLTVLPCSWKQEAAP
jgi:hypothetical protein